MSKTTRPDYPAETPTFSQKKKWREAWRDSLQTAGLAAVLRGEVPFELLKLQPRPLIPETDQSSDNIKVANADIANKNRINREELEGRIREIKTRLGAAICASLRPHAPLKLEKLKKDYPLLNASGTAIPDAYDGVEMFKKLDSDDTVSEYESDLHQKYYERLRDKKLPENCSPQMYCSRINLMVSKINPNLPDPLSGAKLSKFPRLVPSRREWRSTSMTTSSSRAEALSWGPDVKSHPPCVVLPTMPQEDLKSLADVG